MVNTGYAVNVKLEKLSAIYLPYKYTPTTYDMSETVVEQLSYDADAKLLYTVGKIEIFVSFTAHIIVLLLVDLINAVYLTKLDFIRSL